MLTTAARRGGRARDGLSEIMSAAHQWHPVSGGRSSSLLVGAFSYKFWAATNSDNRLPMVLSVLLLGVLAFNGVSRVRRSEPEIYAGLFVYTARAFIS